MQATLHCFIHFASFIFITTLSSHALYIHLASNFYFFVITASFSMTVSYSSFHSLRVLHIFIFIIHSQVPHIRDYLSPYLLSSSLPFTVTCKLNNIYLGSLSDTNNMYTFIITIFHNRCYIFIIEIGTYIAKQNKFILI